VEGSGQHCRQRFGFLFKGFLLALKTFHNYDGFAVIVFGNEDVAEACFNFGNGDGDSFTVNRDFVFRFHFVFVKCDRPGGRSLGKCLGGLEFQNIANGGGIPSLPVAC
jgi:hypothetical protein